MRIFNEKLHKEIIHLKALHTKRDKAEFMKARNAFMKRWGVCKSTVYRRMKKPVPGMNNTHCHSIKHKPVTDEEINMVTELLFKQHNVWEIKAALERHTGDSYGFRRIEWIRKAAEKRSSFPDASEPKATAFGNNVRKLFMEFCNFDLTDPTRIQTLKLKGKEYKISCGVIKEAIDMIIFSTENEGQTTPAIQRLKMENMLSRKLELISKGQYVAAYDLRILEQIRKSLEQTNPNVKYTLTPDCIVVAEVCREIRPDLSDVEICILVDKHQRRVKNSSEDIVPFRKEVMQLQPK